jgi:hypothetical protein
MSLIEKIRDKVANDAFEFSQHAVDQTILRHITVQEIREAIAGAELVEDYPDDKYGPSCLLLGFTQLGRAVHVQCSYPSRQVLRIITVYEPDPSRWIDYRERRH